MKAYDLLVLADGERVQTGPECAWLHVIGACRSVFRFGGQGNDVHMSRLLPSLDWKQGRLYTGWSAFVNPKTKYLKKYFTANPQQTTGPKGPFAECCKPASPAS
jgi:hypothetical protein